MKYRQTIARWTFGALAFSLPGLWLCHRAGGDFLQLSFGRVLETLFTVVACVGMLSWAVIILAWRKPTREEIEVRVQSGEIDPGKMSPLDRAALYAAYGSLPRWLYLPFLAVGVVMTILAALGIVGIVIWLLVS